MEQNMNVGTPIPSEKKSMGSVIGIIVIVLVLLGGAYYFLKQVPAGTTGSLTPAETQGDGTITSLSTQGTSTDIADIQNDLNATNFSGIDAGLSSVTI